MAVSTEVRIQAFVLLAVIVVGIALPAAIAELATPSAFAILAILLPIIAILYSNTSLPSTSPPTEGESPHTSLAQWLRWSQYVVIVISLVWTNALLSPTN